MNTVEQLAFCKGQLKQIVQENKIARQMPETTRDEKREKCNALTTISNRYSEFSYAVMEITGVVN